MGDSDIIKTNTNRLEPTYSKHKCTVVQMKIFLKEPFHKQNE